MVANKSTAPASGGNKVALDASARPAATPAAPVESSNMAASVLKAVKRDEAAIADATAPVSADKRTADGGRGKGPKSALEGGVGSFEEANEDKGGISYGVQAHSNEEVGGLKRGVQVIYVTAKSGDEAALKVREAHKANYGLSIRGVSPASDPDANSMGGERDAAIMVANATNGGAIINTLGTEANAKATVGLAKADIESLGE